MARCRTSELAQIIAQNTAVVEKYYQERNLPPLSFEPGALKDAMIRDNQEVEKARLTVIDASLELHDLMLGPAMHLQPTLDTTSLQVIYRFDIPSKVPHDEEISYEDLARSTGLEASILRRIIRFAIVNHRLFREKREGFITHSAASKLLADDSDAMASVGFFYEEKFLGSKHNADILQSGSAPTRHRCGWTVAHNTDLSMFEYHSKHPQLATRFTKHIRHMSKGFGHDVASLLYGWNWTALERREPNALVVDLGGSDGLACMLLAREHPDLRFENQDLPHVIETVKNDVPADLKGLVTMRGHDFRQPQPTKAAVYIFRRTLHNWPDADCIQILQALIPALQPGARIIINDFLIFPPGTHSHAAEKSITAVDMAMMTLLGTREREERDWRKLFEDADPRFVDFKAYLPDACCLAIIDVTWKG